MANSKSYPLQFNVEDDILIKYEGYDSVVEIPEGILAIENKAFWYNKFVTKVTMPKTVKAIGNYAFCGCQALTEVNIPDGVRHIGKMAFNGCTKLTSLELPDSVEELGAQAFGNCTSLDSVILAAVKKLPQCVFANCKSLEYLQIPEGVEEIGDGALYECDKLETVVIPGSIGSIGEAAVQGCDNLEEIHYLGTEDEFDEVEKADDFEEDTEDVNIEFTEEPEPKKPEPTPEKKPEPAPKKPLPYTSNSTNNPAGVKIGDTVIVSDDGERYSSYLTWFDDNAPEIKSAFTSKPLNSGNYKVVAMGAHSPENPDTIVCAIESEKDKAVYLLGAKGLSKPAPAPAAPTYTSNSTNNPTGVKVGDTVLVTDSGKRYPSYVSWFEKNAPHLKSRFKDESLSTSTKYKVLAMAMHTEGSSTLCCAIEAEGGGTVHLIAANGIKKYASGSGYISNSTNNPLGLAIGDSVQVSDSGKQYSSYSSWLSEHAPTYMMKFVNNKKVDTSATYKIVAMGNHSAGNDTLLCAIDGGMSVFIMGALGLKKASAFTAPSYTSTSTNNPSGVKVGDTVEISNAGQQYPSFVSWFDTHAPHLKSRFVKDDDISTSVKYKVLAMGYHGSGDTLVCAVEHPTNSRVYLIGATGVRKASATTATSPSYTSNSTNNPAGIKVGDTVAVSNSGQRYPSYSAWFTTNAPHLASRFAKDTELASGNYTVLAMGMHSSGSTTLCCAIEHTVSKKVWLIGATGLKKAAATVSTPSGDLQPGDTVVVIDDMQRYPTYRGWFDAYAPELKSSFAYDEQIPSGSFTLVKMAPHTGDKSVYVCCLRHNMNGKYYLVQRKGVAKASGSTTSYSAPSYTSNSTNNPAGIKVGDTVAVSNSGQRYPSYSAWFTTNAPHLASRFAKDTELASGNYTVLAMGMHSSGSTTLCCAIEHTVSKKVWLIGATGLKKASGSFGATSSFGGQALGNLSNNPNGIRMGDTVAIVNSGKQYTTYTSWFDKNAPHLKSAYAYSTSINTYARYTVVAAAPHSVGNDTLVCAVKGSDGKVYLIGALGIKRA